MNYTPSQKFLTIHKIAVALALSLATNIFLIAFLLGRADSAPPAFLPPPPPFHDGMDMIMGPPPPPLPQENGRRPPLPFFGPSSLFSPQEMRDEFKEMQNNFERIKNLRDAFAQRLKNGPVSKPDVLQHFAAIEQLMSDVRGKTQEKVAEKISKMSAAERQEFAERLLATQKF